MANQDLENRLTQLRAEMLEVQRQLDKVTTQKFLSKSEFGVGSRVLHWGKLYEITTTSIRYGSVRFCGKRVLKDGSLGVKEFELYGKLTKPSEEPK